MSYNVSIWLIILGVLCILLPGFNLLGVGALALGGGNAVGRLAGPTDNYRALR